MVTLDVDCGASGKYKLFVGKGVRAQVGEECAVDAFSQVFVLTEKIIEDKWISSCPEIIQSAKRIVIPSGEASKSIATAESAWDFLLSNGADRKSLLINIGGGMATDLGGFIASTYMRGMNFIHLPTTLLSQVDASIGGKTGINFGGTKNIIGTFTQPQAVFIDTDFLTTLPARELRAGLAEVLKHGLICDHQYFDDVVKVIDEHESIDSESVAIISRSCEIKRDIVAADEKERGLRKLLNFGHTFGHAFESLSFQYGEPLLHGEAIAVGMVAEAMLSESLDLLSAQDVDKIRKGISSVGLPVVLPEKYPVEEVYALLVRDKKNTSGKISWTLLSSIGCGEIDQFADKGLIESCYKEL